MSGKVLFFSPRKGFRGHDLLWGRGHTGSCFDAVFLEGIRLGYHTSATALTFGSFRGFGVFVCSMKNHMLLIKWQTAYCAHATIFKRVLYVIQIKVRHFKTFARKMSMKYIFFMVLLQTNNESLFSELKIKQSGVTDLFER